MAFKSIKEIENNRYKNLFHLDDGKSINGVFLYHDYSEVLIAEAHYIKTAEYSGYVHCTGAGCPACRKNIRVQRKLFIPILVLSQLNPEYEQDSVIFWDRNEGFMHQLKRDVFDKSPYPTDTVYKITRHGAYRDLNTTYSISAKYNFNNDIDDILASMNITLPDYYSVVIRDLDAAALDDLLDLNDAASSESSSLPTRNFDYSVTPRKNTNLDLDSIESLIDTTESKVEAESKAETEFDKDVDIALHLVLDTDTDSESVVDNAEPEF